MIKIQEALHYFVFNSEPFILSQVSVKSPQVVFQVSCVLGLPVEETLTFLHFI